MSITPILLCGGSGKRLWPASRSSYPKQFIKFIKNKSFFDLSLERIKGLINYNTPIIITSKNYDFLVKESILKHKILATILLEPEPKDTTAAIYLAAKLCKENDRLLVMPSDHLINDVSRFCKQINEIDKVTDNKTWVTFAIRPNFASDAFGYIELDIKNNLVSFDSYNELFEVLSFIEKPNQEDATRMIKTNKYFWNSGIFMGTASMILESIQLNAPEIAKQCDETFKTKIMDHKNNHITFDQQSFSKISSISIDYSIMEKAKNIKSCKLKCDWDDIGSWDSIAKIEAFKDKSNQNIVEILSKNNFIKTEKRVIATVGVENLIIIDSDNATLIAKKGFSNKVKEVVDHLILNNNSSASENSFTNRLWGKYEILLDTKYCKVKKLIIAPSKKISLQFHNHRSEHWIVVVGVATVHLNGKLLTLNIGESIDIPKKMNHFIQNNTSNELIIIETQLGNYFGEDDIVRLDTAL